MGYFQKLVLNEGTCKLGGFESQKEMALSIENLLIVGCGSSYNAALYG